MEKVLLGDIWFNKIKVANSFSTRLKGLMFLKNLEDSEGLLLENCNSIHTFFMRFTIDVAYLDKNYMVIGKETIKPWKVGKILIKTKHVFECNKNSLDCVKIGDKYTRRNYYE